MAPGFRARSRLALLCSVTSSSTSVCVAMSFVLALVGVVTPSRAGFGRRRFRSLGNRTPGRIQRPVVLVAFWFRRGGRLVRVTRSVYLQHSLARSCAECQGRPLGRSPVAETRVRIPCGCFSRCYQPTGLQRRILWRRTLELTSRSPKATHGRLSFCHHRVVAWRRGFAQPAWASPRRGETSGGTRRPRPA